MPVALLLARIAVFCARRAALLTVAGLVLIGLCGALASQRLSVNSDLDSLFAASLPWKQRDAALRRDFPQTSDLLVAVVQADIPEEADATAAGLADALGKDSTHFKSVTRPDALPFFNQEGLLFLDKKPLSDLLDRTIDAQPFLGQLANDPSARGLFSALNLMAMGVAQGQANTQSFAPALRAFHTSLDAVAKGKPQPLSWETLLTGQLADLGGQYRFVLVQPKLDYSALLPGAAATGTIRAAIAAQPFVQSGQAQVHITGSVALADEEIGTATEGAVEGLLASTALVIVWLVLALRSWRLILPVVFTLFLGLALTTGFATLAVGTLNLISIAFAVLFVGIAVDFAIQYTMRLRETRGHVPDLAQALAETSRRAGVQILVASGATACGFLAFVPTAFVGVAQLGLIAGIGMLVAFVCTVTFLPAALALCRPRAGGAETGFRCGPALDRAIVRAHWPLLAAFLAITVLGLALLPKLSFDSDPLHTKDPNTEAMQTLAKLMQDPRTTPYTADILRPDAAAADALAADLRKQDLVQDVLTLDSFVPGDQAEKLALIADAASILSPTLAPHPNMAPATAADLRLAASSTGDRLAALRGKLAATDPMLAIADDLKRLAAAPDATLLAMNTALTQFLPLQMDRLRTALGAQPVTRAGLPEALTRDWVTPDGQIRVQATAKAEAHGSVGLRRFVQQVQAVAPDAGGTAVTITATADTVVSAFRSAAIGAVIAIAIILALALRRVMDVTLVLLPLLLSALMTVMVLVLRGMAVNFANIIALPLLLGVGVSFNIYFVMNWRTGQDHPLASATARAVVFSALTTGTAFGSLALSAHPGTASMGQLLLISLGCTLVTSLLFVPALLAALRPPAARPPQI